MRGKPKELTIIVETAILVPMNLLGFHTLRRRSRVPEKNKGILNLPSAVASPDPLTAPTVIAVPTHHKVHYYSCRPYRGERPPVKTGEGRNGWTSCRLPIWSSEEVFDGVGWDNMMSEFWSKPLSVNKMASPSHKPGTNNAEKKLKYT